MGKSKRESADVPSDAMGSARGVLAGDAPASARGMLGDVSRAEAGGPATPRPRLAVLALLGTPLAVMLISFAVLWGTLTQYTATGGSGTEAGASSVDGSQVVDAVTRQRSGSPKPQVDVDPHLGELVEGDGAMGAGFLDRDVLMLDEMHYTIADLEARGRSVEWASKDEGVVRIESVKSEGGVSRCHLVAVRQGLTEVTARARGRTATCTVRVISGSSQQRPGDIPFEYNAQIKGQMFYLQEGTWGDSFVEAYINNIEKIVKEYQYLPQFKEEAAEKKLWCYRHTGARVTYDEKKKTITSMGGTGIVPSDPGSGGPFPYANPNFRLEKVLTKKQGAIDANGWILLVTTKNEWGYLLYREEEGASWKVVASKALATGYNREKFEQYMASQAQSNEGVAYSYEKWGKYDGTYQNAVHRDIGNTQGRPASAGCIRLGYLDDPIMYYLYHDADLGTRIILF